MSALTRYLAEHQGGWNGHRSLRECAAALSVEVQDVRDEAIASLEIEYIPTIDGGVCCFRPIPRQKLTREQRKVSKSSQP
jgi:hypothetical protein